MPRHEQRQRQVLAQETARLMHEQGIKDFQLAKRKAAERLRINRTYALPSNKEIEDALFDYQQLFDDSRRRVRELEILNSALKAMRLFNSYQPRLVGPILNGIVSATKEVCLHVFAETVEDVLSTLMDAGIPHSNQQCRLRFTQTGRYFSTIVFAIEDVEVEAVILGVRELRQPPLCPVSGKPMARANQRQVEELLHVCADQAD